MIKSALAFKTGVATDPGTTREVNEDRAFIDENAGIFLVVDGMGGHAAGERAAAIAAKVVPSYFELAQGSIESRIRAAITAANNEIFQAARTEPQCAGMACVLTLAVVDGEKLAVGHVGDSRLYLAWTGGLRKLTSDHSPVGEREDRGELTDAEAMRDPRRNEVFRDVGSRVHEPSDEDFIDVKTFPFRADAAFLLCTDGLSDALTTREINAIVQRFRGDPNQTVQDLVTAANQTSGKDNVTVVFICGPEFAGAEFQVLPETHTRHSITRMRRSGTPLQRILQTALSLTVGLLIGAGGILTVQRLGFVPVLSPSVTGPAPRHISVAIGDPHGLRRALESARGGDVIDVPQGEYVGPIELKEGVALLSASPGKTVVLSGVTAHNLKTARLTGFQIEGGLVIDNSSVEVDEVSVLETTGCSVHYSGNSAGVLRASKVVGNSDCAILIEGESSPRLVANRITHGTIAIRPPARPVLNDNITDPPK